MRVKIIQLEGIRPDFCMLALEKEFQTQLNLAGVEGGCKAEGIGRP